MPGIREIITNTILAREGDSEELLPQSAAAVLYTGVGKAQSTAQGGWTSQGPIRPNSDGQRQPCITSLLRPPWRRPNLSHLDVSADRVSNRQLLSTVELNCYGNESNSYTSTIANPGSI